MKLKTPKQDEVELNMAPMIDMVFLLLIFFMVASVVKELDKIEVEIPSAQYAKVPADTKGRMMLSVDNENQIYHGADPVDLEELRVRIAFELDMNPNLRVLVRADELVRYETTKNIMIACAEVGATDLIYATFED
jgi:biopolymer transport protein ExbD